MQSDEEIKNHLALQLATSIVSAGVGMREKVLTLSIGIISFIVPLHISILVFLKKDPTGVALVICILPVLIWIFAFGWAAFMLSPKIQLNDLKNINAIIENYGKGLKDSTYQSRFILFLILVGIIFSGFAIIA